MRCSDCNERNSVAAKKCAACGSALRRKPLPLSLKLFTGILAGLIFIFWLAALASTINNPEKNLNNTASNLTGKSNSAEQMMGNIKHFDQAMHQFLQKYGYLNSSELGNKLSTALPKSLYECHIFEILPNLKLVEIDTALNASNYLVLLSNGQTKVLPIIGLDVYDSNSFLPQNDHSKSSQKANDGQLLVLLGHTAAIHGHQPRVKVLLLSSTLQSDNIIDLTDATVPKLYGEGIAKFSPNQKDIELSVSLLSYGQQLNLFSNEQSKSSLPVENEQLYKQLIWQNNSYSLRNQPGTSKLYTLYALANSLKNHNKCAHFRGYFSPATRRTIEQAPLVKSEEGFTITAYKPSKKFINSNNMYILKNDSIKAIVELQPLPNSKKGPNSWLINSLSIAKTIKTPDEPAATIANAKKPDIQKDPTSTNPQDKTITNSEPTNSEGKLKASLKDKTSAPAANTLPILQKSNSATATTSPMNSGLKQTEPKQVEPKQVELKQVEQGIQASLLRNLKANVKLRSGPSTDYQSIYEVKPNKHISILSKENGWYRVKVDDKEGFIYAGLVSNNKNTPYQSNFAKKNCTLQDNQQHPITNIVRGEHLVILGEPKNNRYKITLSSGKTGYISREAVEGKEGNTSTESPPPFVP